MSNKLTYPFKTMRITQNYNGTTSHAPHNLGSPKDYPIDEGCSDAGRDWMYCPCDEIKIVKIYGVGNSGVNTMWLTSTSKCDLADGTKAVITMMVIHPNDSDLRRLHVGQVFKRGEKICQEGIDGASGNHIHLSVGIGTIIGTGWVKNSKKKWVLSTTGKNLKPEQAFFVDTNFTTIVSSKGITFKKQFVEKPKKGTYVVNVYTLNARSGTTTTATIKKVLAKGTNVNISTVKIGLDGYYWGKAAGIGWMRMDYLEKV